MKRAFLKIIVHSKAFERATHFEANNLGCVQPFFSKDGKALQHFYVLIILLHILEGGLVQNDQPFATRPKMVLFLIATRDNNL